MILIPIDFKALGKVTGPTAIAMIAITILVICFMAYVLLGTFLDWHMPDWL